MRCWTRTGFERALKIGEATTDTVWLASRAKPRLGSPLTRRAVSLAARSGARLGRATVILGIGCVASGAVSNTALAPAGPAYAAVERMPSLTPEPLARAMPLAEVIERAPIVVGAPEALDEAAQAEARFDEQRQEAEDFLRFGSRELPRRLVETIVRAANAADVDPIYLMALADKESSFRIQVKASTSSAEGLFQFVERTWLDMVRSYGGQHGLGPEAAAVTVIDGKVAVADEQMRADILALRREPFIAAVMAAELLKKDAALIGFKIGRKLNRTELYLAHFLGLDGAGRFIAMRDKKKPANAAKVFPAAARANTAIFFQQHKRGRRGLSVHEVYAKIGRMIEARAEIYRDVEVQVADSAPRL